VQNPAANTPSHIRAPIQTFHRQQSPRRTVSYMYCTCMFSVDVNGL